MPVQVLRLVANVAKLYVVAHNSDGRSSVIVAKIVNEAGLKRVLKSHAKFHGLAVAADGLSAKQEQN